jgi:hypothetical protein
MTEPLSAADRSRPRSASASAAKSSSPSRERLAQDFPVFGLSEAAMPGRTLLDRANDPALTFRMVG